jgi:hypothetical protein
MWKSAVSISKVGGKGGKNSFIVFPMLSTDQFPPAASDSYAAASVSAFFQFISNSTGLT